MSKGPWKLDSKNNRFYREGVRIYKNIDEFWYAETEENLLGPYDNATTAMRMYDKWKEWYKCRTTTS
jgi:hypothetical protein